MLWQHTLEICKPATNSCCMSHRDCCSPALHHACVASIIMHCPSPKTSLLSVPAFTPLALFSPSPPAVTSAVPGPRHTCRDTPCKDSWCTIKGRRLSACWTSHSTCRASKHAERPSECLQTHTNIAQAARKACLQTNMSLPPLLHSPCQHIFARRLCWKRGQNMPVT